MKRLDPTVGHRGGGRGVGATGSDFILARLLRCPTCGTRLTGTRDREGRRVRYSCRLGGTLPHERVSISEHLILSTIRDEVGRLRAPATVEGKADAEVLASLEERRARILDLFEAGHIDRGDRERRLAAVTAAEQAIDARNVMAVPEIDWTWEPRRVNGVLRALFDSIALDPATFQPTAFAWTVPEWRA